MPDIRKEALVQENEGFAIIWREAQRKRGELISLWFSQIFNRLTKLRWTNSFDLDPPVPTIPSRQAYETSICRAAVRDRR